MNKYRKILGVMVVGVLVLIVGVTAVALAQDSPSPDAGVLTAVAGFAPRLRHGIERLFTPEEKDAALADALDMSVDELDMARQTARETLLTQAVADGRITQAQADEMANGNFSVRGYLGDLRQEYLPKETVDAIIADALGLTVDDLTAARDAGQRLPEIAAQQGVELSAVQAALQAALADALQQAVADGRITQAQADDMLSHQGDWFRPNQRPFGPRGGQP
ncbi:MAG: hypothetical protein KBE23_16730 [Chloroflexi bacterium]|nr:hypothetical protein [Chloroflexota bacterium]MBP7044398.1 hypothetical protein [Chloroflexota bacterium]